MGEYLIAAAAALLGWMAGYAWGSRQPRVIGTTIDRLVQLDARALERQRAATALQVKLGDAGPIRSNCRVVPNDTPLTPKVAQW